MIVLSAFSFRNQAKRILISDPVPEPLWKKKYKNQCADERRKGIVAENGNWKIYHIHLFNSL